MGTSKALTKVEKMRIGEMAIAFIVAICSTRIMSTVSGGLFLANAFGNAMLLRFAMVVTSSLFQITQTEAKTWIQFCFLYSFFTSVIGSVAVTNAMYGPSPACSYCQAIMAYALCGILVTDAVILANSDEFANGSKNKKLVGNL